MKSVLSFICLISFVLTWCALPAKAQVVQPKDSRSPDQWVSHQMNQPPPGAGDKRGISKDRLDEIEQLYLQAKKELDAKGDPQPKDKK